MFKISVLIGFFMLVLSVSLQGLWINETKTISASQLTDIRSASTNLGIDELTYKLWHEYQTTVRMDSTDVCDSEVNTSPGTLGSAIFWVRPTSCSCRPKRAFWTPPITVAAADSITWPSMRIRAALWMS